MFSTRRRGRGGATGGFRSDENRRFYGFFHCKNCNTRWESSHVYKKPETEDYFKQDCKKCNRGWAPYNVEQIKCRNCGEEAINCECTKEERDERHVDPSKPHRSDLCHKCRSGRPCQAASY